MSSIKLRGFSWLSYIKVFFLLSLVAMINCYIVGDKTTMIVDFLKITPFILMLSYLHVLHRMFDDIINHLNNYLHVSESSKIIKVNEENTHET